MAEDKGAVPMGGDLPEDHNPQGYELGNRNCWAIDVLIEEVKPLFETEVLAHSPNWLNANLAVTFTPSEKEREDMALVMPALRDDERVLAVVIDEPVGTITVVINPNPILMDTRDPFGLDSAVLGLDREIAPDDLTDNTVALLDTDEGFLEGSL